MNIAEKTLQLKQDFDEVYEAGKQEFWSGYQNNGSRANYKYAFAGQGWKTTTLKPKYDINATSVTYMFAECVAEIYLDEVLEELGVEWNVQASSYAYSFYSTRFRSLPTLDITKATSSSALSATFQNSTYLEKLHLIVSENTTFQTTTFAGTTSLFDVEIEGVISKNISFVDSPLNQQSTVNVLAHLANITSGSRTITLSDETKSLMDGVVSPELDNLSYEEYIANKGWTLA